MTINKGNGNGKEDDFVGALFKRGGKEKKEKAQMIPIGKELAERSIEEQAKYWHKLASSLNHVAQIIQGERDKLNKILFGKEAQLTELKKARGNDQMLIHQQLARLNKEKQELLLENQNLLKEIKNLEERVSGN